MATRRHPDDSTRHDETTVHDEHTNDAGRHGEHAEHGEHRDRGDTRHVPAAGHRGRHDAAPANRREALARERAAFGGIKVGSAFFGFLAAMGMAAFLVAIVSAVGVAVGLTTGATTADEAAQQATDATGASTTDLGVASVVVVLVVLFIAYFSGGYVAGRMARLEGAKQGFAVWLWAVIIAVVTAVLAIASNRFDVVTSVQGMPQLPITGDASAGGIVAALLLLLVTLAGSIFGGTAGMRYHRRMDRAAWEEPVEPV